MKRFSQILYSILVLSVVLSLMGQYCEIFDPRFLPSNYPPLDPDSQAKAVLHNGSAFAEILLDNRYPRYFNIIVYRDTLR
jgi:hypothetical protein